MPDMSADAGSYLREQGVLMMAGDHQDEVEALGHTACSECRRRKQKCDRNWPCSHCSNRRVGNQCTFQTVLNVKAPEDREAQIDQFSSQMGGLCCFSHAFIEELGGDGDDDEVGLEQLGYSAAHALSEERGNGNREKKPKYAAQHAWDPDEGARLRISLSVLPSKAAIDALVDNFLNDINFHYYILHPAVFKEEYQQWRDDRDNGRPLGVQWTSLLLMVCACSAQYPNDAVRRALPPGQDELIHQFSQRCHAQSHELHQATPAGEFHIHSLQQLLHSCFWLKTEARYFECWHALSDVAHIARHLSIHCEAAARPASDYEMEMGRRAWAILCTWDWQIGALISRSAIVDPSEYDTQLPSFQLGGQLREVSPSPGLFMALQCDLASRLAQQFGRRCTLDSVDKVVEYRTVAEQWMRRLPPHLAVSHPDRSLDDGYPWLRLQRFTVATMGMSSVLTPLRPYLTKSLPPDSPAVELEFRRDGITYALKYLNILFQFLRFAFPKDAKYHTVVFFIFDIAALLCSAIIHDSNASMPMREPCLAGIQGSLDMLRKLKDRAPIAARSHQILSAIYVELTKQPAVRDTHRRKRPRVQPAPSVISPALLFSPEAAGVFLEGYDFTFDIPRIVASASAGAHASSAFPPPPIAGGGAPSVPMVVYASDDMLTGGTPPQDNGGNVGMANRPFSSAETFNFDGNYIISTQAGTPVPPVAQMPTASTPVSTNRSDEAVDSAETDYASDFEHLLGGTDLGILRGMWDYNYVNLSLASPDTAN
ncbi:hypothetical protein Trco_005139 [Trichoderma cornu-damae]|uniref:Zn(2)-C6 fungal-type domain-containing protein n=1 Tax=Trichoderma cornu-damae TaxID=654480 RepID=A0A9P8QIR7_9HYPO|nr:hypothetical protein Trco_005139 [Trichoderma cornu-damae]